MRRVLAGLVSVTAVVVAAQAGIVSSSAASAAPAPPAAPGSPVLVCPLEPAGTIPCCGPPRATAASHPAIPCCAGVTAARPVCCPVPTGVGSCPPPPPPPPAPPPSGPVTIGSTPNPSTAGSDVTVSGTASTSVTLWQELPGWRSFRKVATATPDAAGAYKFVRGPLETNVKWYVVAGAARSKVVSQRVTAAVTITASPARAHHRAMRFAGRVTPNHAGERLLLQRLVRRGWRTVASTKLSRTSRYSVRAVFAHRRPARVRAVLPADSRNARSFSPVLTLVT